MKKKNWFLLDNAAKIFPCASNKNNPHMFNVSVTLVEDVNETILQEAVGTVLQRFPSFKVRLKKGLFWFYLEENFKECIVKPSESNLFDYTWLKRKNDYLFNLSYYKNKINLTVFHALSDGTGAMEFLKSIVYQYLKFTGKNVDDEGIIKSPESPYTNSEVKDNFLKYYKKSKEGPPKEENAYHIEGTHYDHGVGIIIGTASVAELKKLAKQYDVTLTTYLCALFSYATYLEVYNPEKPIKNPIKLFVPVNMRKIFKDETMRNFAGYVRLNTYFKPEITFEDIILDYKQQMAEKVTKEYLTKASDANVKMERNIFLRLTPLVLKNIAMKIGYNILGDNIQTVSVSNLGVVNFPKSMEKYIENVGFDLGASYLITKNLGVSSYKDKINLSFSSSIVETGLEQKFFKLLTEQGCKVEIVSNYWEK